jgi:hypothetical protein
MTRSPGRQEHFLDHLVCIAKVAQDAVGQTNRLAMVCVIQGF